MGKNSRQIATRTDVNSKRINSFTLDSYKCPTKGEIEDVEFLTVTDRFSTESPSFTGGAYKLQGSMSVNNAAASTSRIFSTTNTALVTHNRLCQLDSQQLFVNYETSDYSYLNQTDVDAIIDNAVFICSKTLVANTQYQWQFQIETVAQHKATSFTSSSGGITARFSNMSGTYMVFVIDTDTKTVLLNRVLNADYVVSSNYSFTTKGGKTTFVFIPVQFNGSASVAMITGNNTNYYIGVKFIVESNTLTKQESYYDSDSKCVQWNDISHKNNATFTIYYGIWNNKSSNAKLDTITVQIKKSSDTTWTDIGSKSIGTVDTITSGFITCKLPTDFNPSVAYDLRLTCGQTTYKQNWKYRWGNSAYITSNGYSWTSYSSSAKTGVCGPIALNSSESNSVLANYSYSSLPGGHRGRSAISAALFQIS